MLLKLTRFPFLVGCLGLICTSSLRAHYLWIKIDEKHNAQPIANLYFEESPSPGDGSYLDPFVKSGKTWVRTIEHPEPKLLDMEEKKLNNKRWMTGKLQSAEPQSLDSYGKFGVYAYGKTNVLLHYYARHLNVTSHEDLHELARAEHMSLDIVPHDTAEEMELRVFWKGKPASECVVYIRGPKGFKKNLKSDDKGEVRFKIEAEGGYTFRTFVEEDISGRDGEDEYSLIRHNATLIISLPMKK